MTHEACIVLGARPGMLRHGPVCNPSNDPTTHHPPRPERNRTWKTQTHALPARARALVRGRGAATSPRAAGGANLNRLARDTNGFDRLCLFDARERVGWMDRSLFLPIFLQASKAKAATSRLQGWAGHVRSAGSTRSRASARWETERRRGAEVSFFERS